jgi:hypothetical protein
MLDGPEDTHSNVKERVDKVVRIKIYHIIQERDREFGCKCIV